MKGQPARTTTVTDDLVTHQARWRADWYATQDAIRGIWFCNRASNEKVRVEPPSEWGRKWQWNITEDGSGVYFRNNQTCLLGS